jgi:hypothetical protein
VHVDGIKFRLFRVCDIYDISNWSRLILVNFSQKLYLLRKFVC